MRAIDKPDVAEWVDTPCHCDAIRQVARRVTRLYDQALAPHGLRITQLPILSRLATTGPMRINALAERLLLDRATLGHNLRPLEAQGLVTMEPGADRRSRVVTMTDAGKQRLREAIPAWREAQRTFEAAFGAEESAGLRDTMLRLARLHFGPAEADANEIAPVTASATKQFPDPHW